MSDSETDQRAGISGYVPNLVVAIVALALFGALAVVYWIRFARQGMRYMLPITIGTTCMAVGYGIRIGSHFSPHSLGIYIGSTLFILLSPCAFLAQNYMLLPRLAEHLGAVDCLFLPPRLIARIFVWSDVITFWIQAGGGGLSASKDANMSNIGTKIAMVGIILQLISFALFTLLTITFWIKTKSRPLVLEISKGESWRTNWRALYAQLAWSCVGFLIRNGYRVAEYALGWDGVLQSTEVYFYCLDALPLFFAIAPWTVIWAPLYLRPRAVYGRAASGPQDPSEEFKLQTWRAV